MEKDPKSFLFMQLVLQHQQIGMMSLGKIENPVTRVNEVNLELAQMTIETLEMLRQKTKGNLSDYERKFLEETIEDLKLNFVKEQSGGS